MENAAVCILFPQRQGCLLRSCWTMWYVRRASHPKGPRSEPQMKTSLSDVATSSVFRSPGRPDTVFLYQWSPVSCLKCRESLQRGNLRKKKQTGPSLAVQWLRLGTSTAAGEGSIPGLGITILCAWRHGQQQKSNIKNIKINK